MALSPSPSPSNSPTFTSSFTSFPSSPAFLDVPTHGDGAFPKPLIREDSWNRIPLEYRPLTPQPRWRKSKHRNVPAEYRSGGVTLRREQQQQQQQLTKERGRKQSGDHSRTTLSRSNSGDKHTGDKQSWLSALVSTVKRPRNTLRKEPPPTINISPIIPSSDAPRSPMITPPLPATTTTGSTNRLAPPRPSSNSSSSGDSVVWDPASQVWRRLIHSNSSAASSVTSSDTPNPTVSFPYSDYTLMSDSERLDYFLDHRVASVIDTDEASLAAAAAEGLGDGEERRPPPPYVQSQWEAVQERRIRRMRMQGAEGVMI